MDIGTTTNGINDLQFNTSSVKNSEEKAGTGLPQIQQEVKQLVACALREPLICA